HNNGDAGDWGIDNDPNANYNAQKEALVANLQVHCKLNVYWPGEHKWYKGQLVQISSSTTTATTSKERRRNHEAPQDHHYVEYEDGDSEWTNLNQRKFQIL
ncbi:MAG: hypothetical protein SGBAC_012096, partial [Bacillariaceae sp.]